MAGDAVEDGGWVVDWRLESAFLGGEWRFMAVFYRALSEIIPSGLWSWASVVGLCS